MLRPPDAAPLLPLWNVNCIKCHALGGVPGLNSDYGFDTQIAELGISCEACHGPAEKHVEFHRAKDSQQASAIKLSEAKLVNPAECTPEVASQICGQCHSSSYLTDPRDWLANGLSGQMALRHQSVVATNVENSGRLSIGSSPGMAEVGAFEQTTTGHS